MSSPIQIEPRRESPRLPAAANDFSIPAVDPHPARLDGAARRRKPDTRLGQRVRRQFARNVRQLRSHKGMTQLDLASAAGLGRSFVSQLERGRFSASLETIAALATARGVPPSLLLT